MKKIIRNILIAMVLVYTLIYLTSCTDNQRAKRFGGTMKIEVPKGYKVTNITWKQDQLWYSYRKMKTNETPDTVIFHENSNFGVLEGTVEFYESK